MLEREHRRSWFHDAWQIFVFCAVQIGGLIYLLASVQASQQSLQHAIDSLVKQNEVISDSLGRMSQDYARTDEHLKSVDRRLDHLEDDPKIDAWRRRGGG